MKESVFQSKLIKELKDRFKGCVILKNDATYIQGIPDLIVLFHERWAALECKNYERAPRRPNQEYYVKKMKDMGFASFIFPENKEEVLGDLTQYFQGG